MKLPVLVAVSAALFAQSVVADVVHVAREEVGIVARTPPITTQRPVSTVKPSTTTSASQCMTTTWGQCGGRVFTGCTKCPPDWVCTWLSDFYSQCLLKSSSSQSSSTSKSECVTTAWNQCGGRTYTGCTKCPPDQVCVVANSDYAQCLPKSSSSSTSSKVTATSTSSIPYPG